LIVTCEQCSTQFHLDDAKVPPGGARVRCSRCKHAFFIAPGGEEPELGSVDRAAQEALDAEAPPPPEPSEDLSAPADSDSDLAATDPDLGSDPNLASDPGLDDGEDLASESDWEFNRESAAPRPSADAHDAAREAIDDLLGSRTPEPRIAAPAPAPVVDEDLGSPESWDLLGDEDAAPSAPSEQDAGAESPRAPAAARFSLPAAPVAEWKPRREPSLVLAWIARMGHAIGWSVTALLFSIVAILTLSPGGDAEAPFGRQRVAGLEAQGISGRWVENAVAGSLYVVSGRLVNPTAQAAALGTRIGVRLLDSNGARLPIELAAAGPVLEERVLRESDPAGIQTRQAEAGLALAEAVIQPGQSLPFEAVVRDLPLAASRFLLEPFASARSSAP
jgi:predicted Zn finger-like uncharacterized protein